MEDKLFVNTIIYNVYDDNDIELKWHNNLCKRYIIMLLKTMQLSRCDSVHVTIAIAITLVT